jgi:hypothetical protein
MSTKCTGLGIGPEKCFPACAKRPITKLRLKNITADLQGYVGYPYKWDSPAVVVLQEW